MKKLVFIFFLFSLGIGITLAQTRSIKGTVFDETGEPLIGVTISVKGTTTGTLTDTDGKFTLSVPQNVQNLTFSFIGYGTQTVKIEPNMTVKMVSDSKQLDEVVVTGMTTTDKRLFTGAATKIGAEDIKLDGIPEISRSLEGRVAGVSVQNVSGTFGAAPKIRVRGATSIYGNSKPIWVVDGVIMEDVTEVSADDLSSGDAVTLVSSVISGLNADDIESFQVLKDGSATSIYGARAMAGVIVVTTKRGKSGSNKISYTGEFTYRLKPSYNDFNIMNSQEQMGVYREMENAGYLKLAESYRASNSGVYGRMYHLLNQYDLTNGQFGLENSLEARNAYLRNAEYMNTDWFGVLFNSNIMQKHAISLSSGTEKATYYTSMSFLNDPGWTRESEVKLYTMNINALYNISKTLSLNLIGNGSYRKQKAPGALNQDLDAVFGTVKRDFDINPYSYALNTSRTLDPNVNYVRNYAPFNILNELENNNMLYNVADLKFQGELKWRILERLTASVLYAYQYTSTSITHSIKDFSNMAMAYRAMDDATMQRANPWLYTDPDNPNSLPISVMPKGGIHRETKYMRNSWDFRGSLTYNNVFNQNHIVNAYGGWEVNALDRTKTWFSGSGMQYDMGKLPVIDYYFFKQLQEENGEYFTVTDTRTRNLAFFGNATYSWQGKYTVNGTIRYEGSNKLGKSRSARWLPTWNLSGSWNAHEEKFFEALKPAVSHLTARLSYSLTADRGPDWVTNSRAVIESYNPWRPFAKVQESGLRLVELENSELTYEKKHEWNVGLDLGFLNNRINVTFDWYKRNNFDLIGRIATMGVGGQILKYANVADMKSQGVELSISSKNIEVKDFKWNTDFIFSKQSNEITKFLDKSRVIDMITGTGFTIEGYPVRSLFSIDFKGLNENGLPTFINEDGDLVVSDINFQDRETKAHLIYEGPTEPTVMGSFGNIFTYKNLKLNVFLTYSFGNVIRLNPVFSNRYSDLSAMPREFANRWTVTGDENHTDIPVIADLRMNQLDTYLSKAYNAYNFSSARIAKGDFVRLKEVSLSYDFPKTLIQALRINDLSLKLQATNLFLLYADKKLNGQDPEFYNTGGVAVPVPKQFTLTLRLGL